MSGEATAYARHVALRQVGMLLFVAALGVAVWHGRLVVTAGLPWTKVIPTLLGLGLSLGAFGANDDTALHLARALAPDSVAAREWAAEQRARPERVAHLHGSPRAGWVLPMLALLVVSLLAVRAARWEAPGPAAEAAP